MLKLAYQIGVELALMKLAQPPTLIAGVMKGGSRARFLENLRKALQFQGGGVPKNVQQRISQELSFYDRAPEAVKVLREAYGL